MALVGSVDSNKVQIHPNDKFSSQGTTVVDLTSTVTIERSYTKKAFTFPIPRSRKRYAEGPKTTIIDLLRDLEEFRLRGKWSGTSWSDVKTNMDNLMTIFQGGGTFYLAWFASDASEAYQVILKRAVFTNRGGTPHVLEFVIDLIKGEERS